MKRLYLIVISLLLVVSFSGCKERYDPAPQITEGEFPFVVEYEINGERHIIEDTVVCTWDGYYLSNNFAIFGYPYSRKWDEGLKSGDQSKRLLIEFEPNTESALVKGRINTESRVILRYGSGGYYLGDPDEKDRYPSIIYFEHYRVSENTSCGDSTELSYEQLEELFGIKIIRFEFSSPIKNTFE